MESVLLVVLACYLLLQGLGNLLDFVNLRYLAVHGAEVPQGFAGHVDSGTLEKMRDYALANGSFGFVSSFVDIIVTLVFFFGGLLHWYNGYIGGKDWPFVVSGILFFLFLFYAETVIKIPFDLYSTFRIEQKFGFNVQTVRMWIADSVKGLVLGTVLYGILLAGAFWIIRALPEHWWLVIWVFFLAFSLFILYISPYVIEPLFNKFTPIEDTELEERIKTMMAKAGLSISRVFAMDASKRSKHSNAYFSGIGHVKRIILFDTLLASNTPDEVLAVLAHEAGHWKKKHILKRLVVMEALALAGTYLAFRLVESDWLAVLFGLEQPTIFAKLLLVGFLGSLVFQPFRPISSWFSRRCEWEADRFAVALTGNGAALGQALVRMGRDNLANLHPHPLYAAIYYSHPPLPDRVAKLMES